jgi:alkylation response protein AidB-like acyl-CoA dehydrogenase
MVKLLTAKIIAGDLLTPRAGRSGRERNQPGRHERWMMFQPVLRSASEMTEPDTQYRALLERAREIAVRDLAPRANQTDQSDQPPFENIRRLAEAGLLGLTTPVAFDGHGAPPKVVGSFLETIASACGVTVFVAFQHLVACRHLAGSENEGLKARLLPALARGELFCTLAFSHLRRPGPPVLRVERVDDTYVFEGTAPWSTGWGLAQEVLLAGTLPDGRSVWVLAPCEMLQASPPMRLCGMNASATVSLTCDGLRIGPERYVKTLTREQLATDSSAAILFFSSLSLGAAVGSIELVRRLATARSSPVLADAANALEQETAAARRAVDAAAEKTGAPDYPETARRVRAWCIDLGVRAAHAAVTASSGSANLMENAAQRLFREAMVYTLIAQTGDLQAAVLERLVRSA